MQSKWRVIPAHPAQITAPAPERPGSIVSCPQPAQVPRVFTARFRQVAQSFPSGKLAANARSREQRQQMILGAYGKLILSGGMPMAFTAIPVSLHIAW